MLEPGEYRLRGAIERDLRGSVRYEDVTPAGLSTLRVTGNGLESSFHLTLDPTTVQQALRRLRERR